MSSARGTEAVGYTCCVVVPIVFGFVSLLLGQDTNWDLRNYHWYNAYAFLTDRFDVDVAPAQTPTFYNPLLDVPLFVLAQHLPARVLGFVLGAVQGLNFVLLYGLAKALLPHWAAWQRGAGGAAIAATGVAAGGSLSLVGATFYDNVVSLFVLAALLTVVRSPSASAGRQTWGAFALAGLLAGTAAGLKLPAAIYGIGLGAACLLLPGSAHERLRRTACFGVAAVVGVLVFDGFWMARLWSTFGNPIFPYFNDVFGSDMALAASYRDSRFIPASLVDAAMFPFVFSFNSYRTGEIAFTDFRIVALFLAGMTTVAISVVLRVRDRAGLTWGPGAAFVLASAGISYLVWLFLFSIYRYIVTLEMLAPLLIAVLVSAWPISGRMRVVVIVLLAGLLLSTTRPGSWGRTEWGARFVEVTPPAIVDPSGTMVVMAGFAPLSWVIPAFPASVPFVRLQGYSHHPDDGDIGLTRVARSRVSGHSGRFFVVYEANEQELVHEMLGRFDLTADFATCTRIDGNLDSALRFCALQRAAAR